MLNPEFKKETFKRIVKENVKNLFRTHSGGGQSPAGVQAVSYAVKDVIIDNWMKTQKVIDEKDPKIVYYMSMEFLTGRYLGNNLLNLTAYKEVKEALEELNIDLNAVEDQERDPALGKRRSWPSGGLLPGLSGIPGAMWPTAAASVTITACSSRRSGTDIRWRCRITG